MKKPQTRSPRPVATPPARRSFVSGWDEIVYLYHRLLYWFYGRSSPARARPFAKRLERLLRREAADHQTIKGEECWSLIHELKGKYPRAIAYRLSEIRLMKRILRAKDREERAGKAGLHYWPHNPSDLAERLAILAILYTHAGDPKRARASIKEARRLSEVHGFEFESQELFDDLIGPAKESAAIRKPSTMTPKKSRETRSRSLP